jgi:hypothetical protein
MKATKARISVPTKAAVSISWSPRPETTGDPSDSMVGATNRVTSGPALAFMTVPPWAAGRRTPPAITSSGVNGAGGAKLGCAVHGPAAGIKTAQIVGAAACWMGALCTGLATAGAGASSTVAIGAADVHVGRVPAGDPFESPEEGTPDVVVLPDVPKSRRMSLQDDPPVVLVVPDVVVSPDVEVAAPDVLVSPDVLVGPPVVVSPDVEVAPPEVEVAPPDVEVAPPEVEVAPPEVEVAPPEVEVAPPDVLVSPDVELAPPDVLVSPDVELVPPDVELVPPDVELAPPDVELAPSSPSAFVNCIDGGSTTGA